MDIATQNGQYVVQRGISLLVPQEFDEGIKTAFQPPPTFEQDITRILKEEVSDAAIKKSIANTATMTLEVTQQCNLRCRYCVYSGEHYHSFRTHNPKRMEASTYRAAIDFLFRECIDSPLRKQKGPITLSFYGGETLLELDHILAAVRYAKQLKDQCNRQSQFVFMLNTNGLLLDLDKAAPLVEEDFRVDISLDGPAPEHDRFRVKTDGSGSFAQVFQHVLRLKEKYPNYFDKNIRFFVTLHPLHDLEAIENFFLTHDALFDEHNVRINTLSSVNLKEESKALWYGTDASSRHQRMQTVTWTKDRWFYKNMIAAIMERQDELSTRILAEQRSFTGACFPGKQKWYVDTGGHLHVCEKINANFPIGSLDKGFDIEAIKKMIHNWKQEILRRKCWECEVW